jgi:hypothetical protein
MCYRLKKSIFATIAVVSVILFGTVLLQAFDADKMSIPLKVEILPVENTYSFARNGHAKQEEHDTNAFLVRFRVSNPSRTPCAIAVMSCSYFQSWGTDNTNVYVQVWSCDANFPHGLLLGSYSGELPVVVKKDTRPGQLSFRMCFTSIKKEDCIDSWSLSQTNWADEKYWSNKIKITVVP